jgi:hypothetical protein
MGETVPGLSRGESHPLYGQDREIVNQLLLATQPDSQHCADAGRLMIRYQNYPGCYDIQQDLQRCLARWQMSRDDLNRRCRSIWTGGWRPAMLEAVDVGSGADVNAS